MSQAPAALVTGAARGIGAAIAVRLAREGMDVAALDVLDCRETADRVSAAGREALVLTADVTDRDRRAEALEEVRRRFGRLDALVNNAGVAPRTRADILDADEGSYDRVMNVNLKGPYFLTQAVARWMIEQRRLRPDGPMCIVNISSISAYTASPSRGQYCLSKAGVSMATRLWAARLAEHAIGVYEVRPGIVATDMTAAVKDKYDKLIAEGLTPIRRWGRPADVADAVAVCARGELAFSTGQVIDVDGGFHLRTL